MGDGDEPAENQYEGDNDLVGITFRGVRGVGSWVGI